jgi:hypothetical protein
MIRIIDITDFKPVLDASGFLDIAMETTETVGGIKCFASDLFATVTVSWACTENPPV